VERREPERVGQALGIAGHLAARIRTGRLAGPPAAPVVEGHDPEPGCGEIVALERPALEVIAHAVDQEQCLAAARSVDPVMDVEPIDMSSWHNAEPSRTAGTLATGAAPSATKVPLASCCHKRDGAEILIIGPAGASAPAPGRNRQAAIC